MAQRRVSIWEAASGCKRMQKQALRKVRYRNNYYKGRPSNYFCLGPVSNAYRAVEQHTCRRLRQWLCVKHKERAGGNTRFPQQALHQKFGLVRLTTRTHSFPWAKA